MRRLAILGLILACGMASAQRGGGMRGGGGVPVGAGAGGAFRAPGAAGAGFGSILFPGGAPGHPSINTSFGSALGATVRGVPPYGQGRPGPRGGGASGYYYGNGMGRAILVPYPVYAAPAYGASYGYGYGYDQTVATLPPMVAMPMEQQAPVVIINQNFKPDTVSPVVREYTNLPAPGDGQQQPDSGTLKVYQNRTGPLAAADEQPTIFLIAMKEGNIMPALAFWVEGDTLHYITRESSHNRISLDRIDREFSVKLNRERGLEFRIP